MRCLLNPTGEARATAVYASVTGQLDQGLITARWGPLSRTLGRWTALLAPCPWAASGITCTRLGYPTSR